MTASLHRVFDPARSRDILRLAGPFVAGMGSQVLLNLVDTAMVGRLGPAPQAAVGLGSFAYTVIASLAIAVGTAVQATAARRDGEQDRHGAGAALDTGLALAVVVGLPLGFSLSRAAPWLLARIADDPEVALRGSAYLATRLVGLGAVGATFCFRGFYAGIGRPGVYLFSLVLVQASNILLNWIFIFGNLGSRPLGERGAALASVVAAVFGVCFYSIVTVVQGDVRRGYRPLRFANLGFLRCARMAAIAWPEGLRGVLVALGFLVFLEMHEAMGTLEAAAGTILLNVASAGFLLSLGMGLACATLVGRHLGRGEPAEARATVWLGARLASAGLVLPAIATAIWAPRILGWFTPDAPVVDLATLPLRIFALAAILDAFPVVLVFSLQGAGATRWVAFVQVVQQYVLLIPLALVLGFGCDLGVLGLWLGLLLSRGAMAWLGLRKVRGDSWTRIRV